MHCKVEGCLVILCGQETNTGREGWVAFVPPNSLDICDTCDEGIKRKQLPRIPEMKERLVEIKERLEKNLLPN